MGRWETTVYILGICLVYSIVACSAQYFPGDQCTDSSNSRGVCTAFAQCPSAMNELMRGIRPMTCGFDRRQPIVCCQGGSPTAERPSTPQSSPQPPRATTPPPPSTLLPALVAATPTVPLPPPITTLPATIPGDRARAWCEKYTEVCPFYITDVGPYEFPHMASVGYGPRGNIKWKCGGSLISEYYVLTAAHCLHGGPDGAPQWVLLGTKTLASDESPLDKSGQIHLIMRSIQHPGYKPPAEYHDVALLKIGPAITMNPKSLLSVELHPACLIAESSSALPSLVATGWRNVGFGEEPSMDLIKVELDVYDEYKCNETIESEIRTTNQSRGNINSTIICAGVQNSSSNTCKGNSGGLLQAPKSGKCQYNIWGIISLGRICSSTKSPSVYMKVSANVDWIENIVWPNS